VRHIGFVRPVQIGKGQHGVRAHHEVVVMPVTNAAALQADHGDAIADLTPVGIGFDITVARRMSTIRVVACPACNGTARWTACHTCGNSGKVLVV